MSSKIASKKRLEKHCDWAFDITTQFRASSDEDSEPDSDQKLVATTTNTGAGGLLIDDLDLSKRGENVAYNPNPFSIAKINAAYRRQTSTVQSPIQPMRPSDQHLATTNTKTGGLLIDDLDLSKREDNAAYIPNPFSISKTDAAYRRQTGAVQSPIPPVRLSDKKTATTNTGAGGLVIDDLDLSEWEDNAAYNPNPSSISKINAGYLRQTGTVLSPIQPVRLSNQKPAATNTGAGGLFIDDLDMSEWEDNAAYNPNPSSNAKVNASYRRRQTSTVNGPAVQATQSVRLANKPTQKQLTKRSRTDSNQTTIMEGFKTQAMKRTRINALKIRDPPLLPTNNPISHNSNLAVNKPPISLLPSASLISSPSPNPSNYLAKMRIPDDSSPGFMQEKSYPKRDAYQYSIEDVDEEWTTLPSKKRKQKHKTGNPSFTKPFHIPGLRLPLPRKEKVETVATSAAPKMTVYLPPPLNFVDVKRPTSNKNPGYANRNKLSTKETEDRTRASPSSPTSYCTDAYPSPSPSRSKRSLSFSQAKRARNYASPRSRPGVRVVPMVSYRPPSPPTSDLPIPSDADIHVEVDHEGIQLRYPEMKRFLRKRRRASAEVWNLMGVDSCGYVWKDVECGGQGEQTEIQIVMWTGLPSA